MADIAAGDLTLLKMHRDVIGHGIVGRTQQLVVCHLEIEVDPGTTDAYPTGGLPLTNFFTDGNAADTGIDTTQPIYQSGVCVFHKEGAVTPLTMGYFNNGGTAAANQTVVLLGWNIAASTDSWATETANADITGATYLGGDVDGILKLTIIGTLRAGEEIQV